MGTFWESIFGKSEPTQENKKIQQNASYTIPSHLTAKELGKVNVERVAEGLQVEFSILMEPQGQDAEGWQTGVALDASASMKESYGGGVSGSIPKDLERDYLSKGWLIKREIDHRAIKTYTEEGVSDALAKGYLKKTPNVIEPIAREFIAYLARNLDADGGTTVIYWACGNGDDYEDLGDFTEEECSVALIDGPQQYCFGEYSKLKPAMQYFVERFPTAARGMYIFITDGVIDDLWEVKEYTVSLANEIAGGKRNPLKFVLIGVGQQINEEQMIQLDNLETGTDVDIWDHKIAREMRSLVEIFSEVVDENQIVASVGTITGFSGRVIKKYTDGLPAKVKFILPEEECGFKLDVAGISVKQQIKN